MFLKLFCWGRRKVSLWLMKLFRWGGRRCRGGLWNSFTQGKLFTSQFNHFRFFHFYFWLGGFRLHLHLSDFTSFDFNFQFRLITFIDRVLGIVAQPSEEDVFDFIFLLEFSSGNKHRFPCFQFRHSFDFISLISSQFNFVSLISACLSPFSPRIGLFIYLLILP